VKRKALEKQLAKNAKDAGIAWEFVREGANHSVWSFGGLLVTIPRHNEINELTAKGILKDTDDVAAAAKAAAEAAAKAEEDKA
jgi:mRNA interferase HicA